MTFYIAGMQCPAESLIRSPEEPFGVIFPVCTGNGNANLAEQPD